MADKMNLRPIFIFSLPRSGSTLVQRILTSHSKISSAAEPWLLLPLLGMLKKEGTASIYSHRTCQMAIEDMIGNMHGGKIEYEGYLGEFVESIYRSLSGDGSMYFIDKTPRYYMMIPEIAALFPDAKFIFLFRNPAQVYASILRTWGESTLKHLFTNHIDLIEGPALLSEGYISVKDKAYALQYEEFIREPVTHTESLLQYLGLQFEQNMLTDFAEQQFVGRMGDKTGVRDFSKIETVTLERWKLLFNSPLRKRLLKRYILDLPEYALATQGYDKRSTLDEIATIQTSRMTPPTDYVHYAKSLAAIYLKAYLFQSPTMAWTAGRHLE